MQPNLNFHPERPCLRASEHFGREHLVQHAYGRLGTDDVQSFAIIGFRKEGKSSFVNYIRHPKVTTKYLGKDAKQYLFLYMDLSKQQINNEADFFKVFYRKVAELLEMADLKNLQELGKITDWLVENNKRLILIFDNFNLIVTNPNFRVSFYEGLRSWFSTHSKIGCIVTSPVQLLHLSIPQELAGSPFFNIFDSYSLSPLSLTDATDLLYQRLPDALQEQSKDVFELIAQVGYSPYPLQQAGAIWTANYTAHNETSFSLIIDEVYQACQPYYQEIYSALKNNQLENIAMILSSDYNSKKLRIDNNLINHGWVVKDKSRMSAHLMELFFREKMGIPEKKYSFRKVKRLIFKMFGKA